MKKNVYIQALLLITLFYGTTAYSQIDPPCLIPDAFLCDNFDSYATGALGPQSSWWTTWSGIEGGTEDGIVSTDYSYSGSNSLLIPEGGVNDVILKLGTQTTGNWHLEWQMYVPDGATAYYNIQDTEIPGILWNLELLFGLSAIGVPAPSGEGVISIPVGGGSFSYPVDTWFLIEHDIDLDANTIFVYLNGDLVYSGEYLTNIGSIDFYSVDADNRYYIDDVAFVADLPAVACAIPDAIFCDNIDTYTVGDPVGPYSDWWSTWSGVEGGAEDGIVSDDYAYSGTNSVLIPEGGLTDVILKLGDKSTGNYRLEWQMYVPDGKSAYYNIQDTEIPGVLWDLELYFGDVTSGTGEFTVPVAGPTFIYPVDEWFLVEHLVDLDANTIEVYIDGILVLSDVYIGNLGGVDFYSTGGINRFYLDDILFIEIDAVVAVPCAIPDAIFCDNIDTYSVGDPVGPYADWWSTWSGVEGGAEDGIVSDDYAFSGTNSVLIPEGGVTDVILKLGDKSTGIYRLQWQMYVPDGKTAYYNIQDTEIPGVLWDLELYFGDVTSGTGEFTVPVAGPTFTYPVDEWFLVEHLIDLDANTIEVYIDGILVLSDTYMGNLGGVDFYSSSAVNRYYLDDILFIEEIVVVAEPCDIPDAIFCDNIDTYTVGEPVGPFADWWSTWSGVEGGAEDGIVSDDYAVSGDNSVLIPEGGVTDVILKLGDLSTGSYRLEWQMFIPSGKTAYYNIQDTEIPGVLWDLELYFGDVTPGTGEFTVPVGGPSFSYPEDEWFLVEHIIDLDANTINVYIDNVLVLTDVYTGNLGGVDFYSSSGVNRYYLDDILFIEEVAVVLTTYYADADGDTYGNIDVTVTVEGGPPAGYVSNSDDCDDTNPAIYPGATEITNGKDDNCNGLIDENVAIDNTTADFSVNIYPVPSNGNFTIELINNSADQNAEIKIYSTTGQMVYNENIVTGNSLTKQINIQLNASGVYLLNVVMGSDMVIKQIVIE